MVVYRYPQALSFVKSTAIEIGGGVRQQLVVVGIKGTAQIQPLEECVEDKSEKIPFVSGFEISGIQMKNSYACLCNDAIQSES